MRRTFDGVDGRFRCTCDGCGCGCLGADDSCGGQSVSSSLVAGSTQQEKEPRTFCRRLEGANDLCEPDREEADQHGRCASGRDGIDSERDALSVTSPTTLMIFCVRSTAAAREQGQLVESSAACALDRWTSRSETHGSSRSERP